MNAGYLVDRKIRLLNAHVVTGRAYGIAAYGRSLSFNETLCQPNKRESLQE